MLLALGLIETIGLIGAIEAADAMVKAANVKLISKEKSTGALVTVKIIGEVAAVRSAVDAGAAAAQRVGRLVGTHIIPRPADEIEDLIMKSDKVIVIKAKATPEPKKIEKEETLFSQEEEPMVEEVADENVPLIDDVIPKEKDEEEEIVVEQTIPDEIPAYEELEKLNVHELRHLARNFESFPIKGRDISKANRQVLLEYFKSIQ